jgi:hypothetical protein
VHTILPTTLAALVPKTTQQEAIRQIIRAWRPCACRKRTWTGVFSAGANFSASAFSSAACTGADIDPFICSPTLAAMAELAELESWATIESVSFLSVAVS